MKTKKRYNLVLPSPLVDRLHTIADEHGITTLEVIKAFIRLGLLTLELEQHPDAALIIREKGREREVKFLF